MNNNCLNTDHDWHFFLLESQGKVVKRGYSRSRPKWRSTQQEFIWFGKALLIHDVVAGASICIKDHVDATWMGLLLVNATWYRKSLYIHHTLNKLNEVIHISFKLKIWNHGKTGDVWCFGCYSLQYISQCLDSWKPRGKKSYWTRAINMIYKAMYW